MVHFMLDAHSQQAVGVQAERLSGDIKGLHIHLGGALDVGIDAGHRQAAFLTDFAAIAGGE